MKFYVKNKMISLRGGSFVTDESGNEIMSIQGKFFTFTRKKYVLGEDGTPLYTIRNKFWHFIHNSAFIYDSMGTLIAKLSNNKFDFKHKFVLTGYTSDMVISGNLLQFPNIKMEITENGVHKGWLIKEWNLLRDSYSVEVDDKADLAFMVALVIAVDNIFDEKRSDND
jgi:uncharacterized protein YxjI